MGKGKERKHKEKRNINTKQFDAKGQSGRLGGLKAKEHNRENVS